MVSRSIGELMQSHSLSAMEEHAPKTVVGISIRSLPRCMVRAAAEALEIASGYDLTNYTPAIILMTDGMSNGSENFEDFREAYEAAGADVPVFSILFGDAKKSELEALAELTNARVFDGRKDLVGAFRSVKGYN